MTRPIFVQAPYELLVAHAGRSRFRCQVARSADNRNSIGLLSGAPAFSTAVITVDDNDFTDQAILKIGEFTLRSGLEWVVGMDADTTAANMALAINRLPGFTASSVAADVNINGPQSLNSGECVLVAQYRGAILNFTLSPSNGFFTAGGQTFGAIEVS